MQEIFFDRCNIFESGFDSMDDDRDRIRFLESTLKEVIFNDYRLCHMEMNKCFLIDTILHNLELKESTISNTTMRGCSFISVDMPTGIYNNVLFEDTTFSHCTIGSQVKFHTVVVSDVEFISCDMNLNSMENITVKLIKDATLTLNKTTQTTISPNTQTVPLPTVETKPTKHPYRAFLYMSTGVSNATI